MSEIILDADGLEPGMVIKEAVKIQADRPVSCSEYLCILVEHNGEEKRLMFPSGHTGVPMPHSSKMLELYLSGSRFFSLEEIGARQNGSCIVERPRGELVEGEETVEERWERLGNTSRIQDRNKARRKGKIEVALE